jgi:NAD(P)-dependent dehydrogenase (short-subunit alcohol dehydrogenase family)
MSRKGTAFIVTGGCSGLGYATVEKLATEGASVLILDRQDEAGAEICKKFGPTVQYTKVDVTDENNVKAAISSVKERFGRLDGIVNCAGVGSAVVTLGKRGPHPSKNWDMVLKINLYGTFNCCKYAAEVMAQNEPDDSGLRGVIVNVASVAAFEAQKGQVAYAASKGGVVAMSLPMARDLARYGIRVICVAPGIMDTPLMQMSSQKVKDNLMGSVVAPKRFGRMEEFASLVAHIVDNRYMNAQTIRLDAGIRFANL